jgi:SNF family Na+-dependent transporter
LPIFLVVVFALNFWLVHRGLSKGIETFCNIALPTMALLAVTVLVRVLTLGIPHPDHPERDVVHGLGFMWDPHGEKLWKASTWLAAAGQIFFSLAVGFGIIINYASYLKRNDDVVLSGMTAAATNEFFEVCLGGLITLPAAFVFLGPSMGDLGTFGLGFNTLPIVFAQMPAGRLFGALWFFMLFLAAITSSISMLQPVVAFFEEGLGWARHRSVIVLAVIAALGTGFVAYFSKDLEALDTLDFWVGTFAIVGLAFFQSILYGWLFGTKRGEAEAHRGAEMRIPKFVQWILRYVTPVYLAAVLGTFLIDEVPGHAAKVVRSPVALASIGVIATLSAALLWLIHIADRRWHAAKRHPMHAVARAENNEGATP